MNPLPPSHPSLALKSTLHEICKDFLSQNGFSYFQYLRCYADGSIGFLSNKTDHIEYFSELGGIPLIYSSFKEVHKNLHSYWFLWDEELPHAPVQLVRTHFHLHHGLTLVRRFKDFYDLIAVALPEDQPNIGSFYLNKFKMIEGFISHFDRQNQSLLQIMDQHAIILPEEARDCNYTKMCLPKGHLEIPGTNTLSDPFHITSQELACLRLYLQGQTYKEIASSLKISPRTVETYLGRVRLRSGSLDPSALSQLLPFCP